MSQDNEVIELHETSEFWSKYGCDMEEPTYWLYPPSDTEEEEVWPEDVITTPAMKFDNDKNRLDLISPGFLEGLGRVLTHGAKKYEANNWKKGIKYDRVYGALLRHLNAWWGGEDIDPESGDSHLYHAGCCIMMLSEFEREQRKELDTR